MGPKMQHSASRALTVAFACLLATCLAEDNVYDKPMVNCGNDHANGCTYSAMDAGAHEVCVTKLPMGFSADTGQGPWSDQFTGKPWCICIWAYSNYILSHSDLPLRCKSIPDKVIDEQYSLDKYKECGKMSSTQGCGAEDIRRSIKRLCDTCGAQAPDAKGKKVLEGKCDALLKAAGAKEEATAASLVEVIPETE